MSDLQNLILSAVLGQLHWDGYQACDLHVKWVEFT